MCKKLQGTAANTANWATNVGNEKGEVLTSVLTESEGSEALSRLATGLMDRYIIVPLCVYVHICLNSNSCRYESAGQQQPLLLYTDRDCCSKSGPSKYNVKSDNPILWNL